MSADTPLILRAHPFTQDTGVYPVRGGQTLQAMLTEGARGRDIGPTVRVEIGGYEVPRELWAKVRPKAGVPIHCTVMPAGGNGGGSKILKTVLLVALTYFTAGMATGAVTYSLFGLSAAASAGLVYMVGSLAINALIPPPKPASFGSSDAGAAPGRWNMLTGTSNQIAQYGAIPFTLGECKVFPPHAAMPYTEVLGDTSYQRLMFDLGHDWGGPDDTTVYMDVTDIKIGDTAISSFTEVDYEITKVPTLYTSDINEVVIAAALASADEPISVERTTDSSIDEISLDIVFPQGLFGVSDTGGTISATVNITVEYRETGTSTWIPAPAIPASGGRTYGMSGISGDLSSATIRGTGRDPFAVGAAWPVVNNASSYDVKVTRNSTNWGSAAEGNRVGDAQWAVMRSITNTNPSTTGTVKLCMRIKSTDQLNGTLQTLSCVVHQKVPVYDAGTETWGAPELTYNTAWVYAWLLRECPGLSTHVPDSRIDLDSLVDYAAFCEANGFETRGVVDASTTARALLDDVLACSLGAISHRDGKYGVLFDDGSTLPTMTFTPLDSRNFRMSRVFTRLPHALKVRFRNPEADWEIDEIIVLNDGYSLDGVDARGNPSADPEPSIFETLELRMSCDAHSAWRIGRMHFAQAKFRGTNYEWDTDIANLGCTRGDCVHVAHDVPEWGDGWGRVVSLVPGGEGGAAATLVLDEIVTTTDGSSYSVRIRHNDGSSEVIAATPHSVETTTFYLASLPVGTVNAGDVVVVGETSQVTEVLLLTGIKPGSDLSATMTAVAFSDEVAAYWADPPAVIPSAITGISYREAPPAPNITVIVSSTMNETPDDAGISAPQVQLRIPRVSGYRESPKKFAA